MFELIPSKTMREYLKAQGREFTDFEKAALIWNAPHRTLSERIAALEELAESTSDELLKTQIAERIEYENAKLKAIGENSNRDSVFVVSERNLNSSEDCGIFWDFGRALEFAKWYSNEYDAACCIDKQRVAENGTAFEDVDNLSANLADVYLDKSGEVIAAWSAEISEENFRKVKDRFEDHFFEIPFGLEYCSVKDVTDNTFGVLAQNQAGWNKYMKIWRSGEYSGLEFYDIQVIVFFLTENGIWSHEHINPLYLEPEMPEIISGDEKQAALIEATTALVDYFNGETEENSKRVLDTAKKYAAACRRLKNTPENAETAEGILW